MNLGKYAAYAVSCHGLDLSDSLSVFGGQMGYLPCKYLGLPLGYRTLGRLIASLYWIISLEG